MGYFKDVFGLLLLKDEAYRKVGNDKYAFRKYFLAFLISLYLIELFLGIVVFGLVWALNKLASISAIHLLVISIILILLPFIIFIINFILTLIPHAIGIVLGGKSRTYRDFFKTINYTYPVVEPIVMLFSRVLNPLYSIWWFFMLYKAYRIIHKLNTRRAGLAIVINLILMLIIILIMVIFLIYMIRLDPSMIEKIKSIN